jgi:hypothetical protein
MEVFGGDPRRSSDGGRRGRSAARIRRRIRTRTASRTSIRSHIITGKATATRTAPNTRLPARAVRSVGAAGDGDAGAAAGRVRPQTSDTANPAT